MKTTSPSSQETFSLIGPSHLSCVDWKNSNHRRAIAACLVEATYKIEQDRQENHKGTQAEAPPWWEFFHFQLNQVLIDNADHSIFGAVYELKFSYPPQYYYNINTNNSMTEPKPPKYVIAFRGTLTQPDTRSRDLHLDLQVMLNKVHKSSRFQHAMQSIKNIVLQAGVGNVWLAGHSLGSAIALLAGKNMTKLGFLIETFLFNPPFISAPIERIKTQSIKHGVRIATSVVKAGLSTVVKSRKQNNTSTSQEKEDSFIVLSNWSPYLFVNPSDLICSEYIGYFEHRKKMEEIGAAKIERLATRSSIGSLFSDVFGNDAEPFDLLPCAILTINLTPSPDLRRSHGLEQWWNPNFHFRTIMYQFSM